MKADLMLQFLTYLLLFKLDLRSLENRDNDLLIFVCTIHFNQFYIYLYANSNLLYLHTTLQSIFNK